MTTLSTCNDTKKKRQNDVTVFKPPLN